jgi:hypothetical protein
VISRLLKHGQQVLLEPERGNAPGDLGLLLVLQLLLELLDSSFTLGLLHAFLPLGRLEHWQEVRPSRRAV